MNYLGLRKLSQIHPKHICCLLGYDIYVPNHYFNPLSFLKSGCPIWIEYGNEGECKTYEIKDESCWMDETVNIIKHELPRRKGWYCKPITNTIKATLLNNTDDYYGLSSVCYNENDEVKAIITLDKDKKSSIKRGIDCALISNIICFSEDALSFLWNYITRDDNINKHRGLLISYMQDTHKYGEYLHLIENENGKFYWQFE